MLSVRPNKSVRERTIWQWMHLDGPLLCGLLLLAGAGLLILYSAGSQNMGMVSRQGMHFVFAFVVMLIFAQISPATYQRWAPFVYGAGVLLLILVLLVGHRGKGAARWLGAGAFMFQPSELMKPGIPLFLAWYCHRKHLPLSGHYLLIASLIIFVPVLLTAKEPDLGTAILQALNGGCVLFLAGMSWYPVVVLGAGMTISVPVIWHFLHDYQKQRILTFLNPERDPLGAGYHIIQSKIAIGSGGLFGKGFLHGTQSHLHFLPEHATDFIFAVCGEETGFVGCVLLIALFLFVVIRGLQIAVNAQDTFSRLLAGSLSLAFFISFFINMGMVTGILPVVGLPLPLISYGGSSMVTLMAGFGILMSIQTHRRLLAA